MCWWSGEGKYSISGLSEERSQGLFFAMIGYLWFNVYVRWIYISPHLDDVVFSVGGLINEQIRAGGQVEVWTLMCGFSNFEETSPLAQALHRLWKFRSAEEAVRLRRGEDLRAMRIVGARAVHFDFLDCIYRRGQDGRWLYVNSTFVSPHGGDAELVSRMTHGLAERLESADRVVCPLAIGNHVDHVLTKRAVEDLGRALWYYADVPYLQNNPSALDSLTQAMNTDRYAISWRGLAAWKKGAAAYASQIPMEFETTWKLRRLLGRYGRNGICLWRPR